MLRNALLGLLVVYAATSAQTPSAVDSQGFIYLVGTLSSPATLPASVNPRPAPVQETCKSTATAPCTYGYVEKWTPAGDRVLWASYFGSSAPSVAVASDDSVYIAGSTTSQDVLTLPGGYRPAPASLIVAKLDAGTGAVLAATYFGGQGSSVKFGGRGYDIINGLKLDSAGNVVIFGNAEANPFPTTTGAFQRARSNSNDSPCTDGSDGFIAKFDPALSTLIFSTLMGRPGRNNAFDLAFGPDGSLYIAGSQGWERSCPQDGAVARLTADARSLIYYVFTGTPSMSAHSIAVDAEGNAYAGTDNRVFPPPYRQTIVKFDPHGAILMTRTISGQSSSLAVAPNGDLVGTGRASPLSFAPVAGGPGVCGELYSDDYRSFVARFSALTLETQYAGYFSSYYVALAGPDRVLVTNPYASTQAVAVLPAGPPSPGTVTCMANAANYHAAAIAPGEFVSLFGISIGPAASFSAQPDAQGAFPTSLGGCSVQIGGLPAQLLYAGPNQINAIVPAGIAAFATVPVELHRGSDTIARFGKTGWPAYIGLFTSDGSGAGPLVAVNQDGSVNSPASPASSGSVVAFFGAGFGAIPAADLNAMVDGRVGSVQSIDSLPSLAKGVVQVTVRLPQSLDATKPAVVRLTHTPPSFGGVAWGSNSSGTIYVR